MDSPLHYQAETIRISGGRERWETVARSAELTEGGNPLFGNPVNHVLSNLVYLPTYMVQTIRGRPYVFLPYTEGPFLFLSIRKSEMTVPGTPTRFGPRFFRVRVAPTWLVFV
jgi:hypothetical protein